MYSCRFRFLGLVVAGLFIAGLATSPLSAASSTEMANKTVKVLPKTIESLELRQTNNDSDRAIRSIAPALENDSDLRVCEDCEFDWSAYGSECCDTAWDEFGIDCATLEATYGWDCAGCLCPGDGEAVCGDGFCTGDETYETCPDDCLPPGECAAGEVLDCDESGECWTETWIGDGFCDGTAQQYGADLCCFDNDGGDCTDAECDGSDTSTTTTTTTTGGTADCTDCELDWTAYGSECCDSAWVDFGIDCATLEATYGWDCAGCNCPGDVDPVCGDGICNGDETFDTCPEDCNAPGECDAGYVTDCVDDDCCPESWIGDGFEDCEDQAYGCDLTCYDNDGGDCPEPCDGFLCWDGQCVTSEDDCSDEPVVEAPAACTEGTTLYDQAAITVTWSIDTVCGDGVCNGGETYDNCPEDCPAPGECAAGEVADCDGSGECWTETWIGDGFCDGTAQQYGADLCCFDNDGGDCTDAECDGSDTSTTTTTTGGTADCTDCELDWSAYGSECCDTAWDEYGIDCATLEATYGWDCAGCNCPGDNGGTTTTTTTTTGGTADCADCELDWSAYGSECCDTAWVEFGIDCATLEATYGWDCAGCNCPGDGEAVCGDGNCTGDETYDTCPDDCLPPGECAEGQVADCADDDCHTESWIADGFCDGTAQQYGADLCCFDNDGGDCTDEECAPARSDVKYIPQVKHQLDSKGKVFTGTNAVSINGATDMNTRNDIYVIGISCDACLTGGPYEGTFNADPSLGEFTVYGFDALSSVSVTLTSCTNEGACSDAVGPMNVIAGANDGVQDCTEGGGGDPCDGQGAGDANNDGTVNVLDVVGIVNDILAGGGTQDECATAASDYNGDGTVNVLDVVAIVNVILSGGGRTADATEAKMTQTDNSMSISADGYIGGVQMTLSHDSDFNIELTDNAYIAEYKTTGNSTTLIIINPEGEEMFTFSGDFEVEEVLVTNSEEFINVVNNLPVGFSLSNAYPNPFNPTTTIELNLSDASYASVKVFNLKGEVVGVLMDGMVDASSYTMTWDASNLSSGVYMIKAEANGQIATQKVMLVK